MLNIAFLFCLRRDLRLHHALRGVCFHTLQGTKSATPDALHLQGLCRTSRRFILWVSTVIMLNIAFLFCLRRDFGLHHALRGVCFHTLQGTKSATLDALHLQGLCRTSRRFSLWVSTVSMLNIAFLICLRRDFWAASCASA
jgi:hypothetical protein